MIVRDSHTPFGRVEPSGPTSDYDRIQALGLTPVLPDGETWKTLNDRLEPNAFMFSTRQPITRTVTPWTVNCQECGDEFTTVRNNALYCGVNCRQRACKRKKREALA